MKIFGLEIRRASGLRDPEQWLTDAQGAETNHSGVVVNEHTAMRLSAVWGCVRILSESVATLPLIFYKRSGDAKNRATDHPLYSLLHDAPNSEMTAWMFRVVMMAHLCLRGNAYAEIEVDRLGRPLALWPIPFDQFRVTPKRDLGRIVYEVGSLAGGNQVTIPSERMFHLMGLSLNGFVGLSPIAAARQGIGLGLAAEEYGARFFGNGANLGGVLEHPGKLSEPAAERLRASWTDRQVGLNQAHRTAILEEGMKYTSVGIPPRDANFIESRNFQVTDIARIFRVPPHMLQQLDRATWSNIEHQGVDFVVHSLGPWLEMWEQSISWKLLTPGEKSQYYAEFLVAGLLRGDTKARYDSYAIGRQQGFLSANDIRKLENMSAVDGGDVYLVPLNMVPADQADVGANLPAAQAPAGSRSTERRDDTTGPDQRRQLAETHAPVFRDVFQRLYKRERADVMRQARKSTVTADALTTWLDEYYRDHPEFCARTILPALESYADAVGQTTDDETGATWTGLSDDLKVFLAEYSQAFGQRESIRSNVLAISTVRQAAADGVDHVERLDAMFTEWGSIRTEADTVQETTLAADAIVQSIATPR